MAAPTYAKIYESIKSETAFFDLGPSLILDYIGLKCQSDAETTSEVLITSKMINSQIRTRHGNSLVWKKSGDPSDWVIVISV